jgi:hypothetical protein
LSESAVKTITAAATVLAWVQWFNGDVIAVNLFWGAVTMAAVAVAVGAARLWDRSRSAGAV